MMLAVEVLLGLLGPESLIENGGLMLLAAIVFAESGLHPSWPGSG